jgi:hypothetical protein
MELIESLQKNSFCIRSLIDFINVTFFWVKFPCGLVGRGMLSPSSGLKMVTALKMETACFFKMLTFTSQSTQQLNPKNDI